MTKEEIIKSLEKIEDEISEKHFWYKFIKSICYLLEENKELQQRIDKAIEYMKNNATSNYFDKEKNMFRREEDLLEILRGEINERK